VGFVELSESLAYQQAYVRDTLVRAAWATLAAVLVAALLAAGLGFYMVGRPLAKLAHKARSIGAGDLSGTLNLRQRDEIGELAREFDAMCDGLEQARVCEPSSNCATQTAWPLWANWLRALLTRWEPRWAWPWYEPT
jgi:nitrogen fixation/metabolism regulation signal transduction histidine kinase